VRWPIAIFTTFLVIGCASKPKEGNPSFPVTIGQAREDLARMAKDPKPLARPIVLLGGYADPGIGGLAVGSEFRKYLPADAKLVTVSFTFCGSFESCRRRVLDVVKREVGDVEVDVIGLSMGGLVGRYCAAQDDPPLRVHTLFTISSPHTGALRAEQWPQLSQLQADMTAGSAFYQSLQAKERAVGMRYEVVPYVWLGDTVVGPQNAAPLGWVAWWVPNVPGEFTHIGAMRDPRIMADVLRRLRGEKPWTTEPAAPLPVGP
jgi:hypothetical protein